MVEICDHLFEISGTQARCPARKIHLQKSPREVIFDQQTRFLQIQEQSNIMKQSRSLDTTLEIERIQIDCLRRKSPSERLKLAIELTRASRGLLAVGVRRRHPGYDAEQVRLAVIRLTVPEGLFLAAYPHARDLQP